MDPFKKKYFSLLSLKLIGLTVLKIQLFISMLRKEKKILGKQYFMFFIGFKGISLFFFFKKKNAVEIM